MKALLVQIKREFWEHRSLWIGPLAIAGLLLAALLGASLFGLLRVDNGVLGPNGFNGDPNRPQPPLFDMLLFSWGVPFYLTTAILVSVYLLDCLYGDRRDRSILFWKSMPVSDLRTVMVKFMVGLVIVPLGTYLLAMVAGLIFSGILLLRLHHDPVWSSQLQWSTLSWLRLQLITLYGLIAALLWYAPYAAYLMLASAWARRSVYAWAFVPPVVLALIERMMFGTHYVGNIVQRGFDELLRLAFGLKDQLSVGLGDVIGMPRGGGGGGGGGGGRGPGRLFLQPLNPADLLSSPQLWIGLIAAALMLTMAVRLRRYRDDS